jgi:hypothetical protein
MSIRRVLAVTEAQARDLSRRRVAIVILVMLPLLFYVAVGSETAFALVAGGTGMAWSVAGAALFLALAARRTDQRLVLAGYRPLDILVGRLLCLEGFALVLVAVFSVLMVSMSAPPSPGALVLALVLTAAIAVPLGLAVAALLPRELEGALALIGIVGIEMSLPVDSDLAPVLPLYGPLRLIEAAGAVGMDVWSPIVHAVISAIVLLTVAAVLWWRRIRIVRHRP